MNIIDTELNERLAQWVRKRVSADLSLIKGRASFWRSAGLGFVTLGLGVAIGISSYGYSLVMRNTESMSMLAKTFSTALANAQLQATAEGTVQIEPNEIKLAPGQTVTLDRNARIGLDPEAKVLAEGNIRVQSPTPTPVSQRSPSHASITNFTVFKSVPFEQGTVLTGWKFASSSEKTPASEYCYYTIDGSTPDIEVIVQLGRNGELDTATKAPKNFDIAKAFDKCVWFGGMSQ
jgi:hypothetical protein